MAGMTTSDLPLFAHATAAHNGTAIHRRRVINQAVRQSALRHGA